MNYRHSYHAGNFADVFKHVLLALLLQSLRAKEKSFCYLDTHAGAGHYDLQGASAQKTGEYRQGIAHFWGCNDLPAAIVAYLDAVRVLNENGELRYYPGSPRVAQHFLRPHDRMVLMDLHPDDAALLKQEFRGDQRVHVHCADGFSGLKAFLPPPEKRGLVLIDPPFEQSNEFKRLAEGLQTAYQRWNSGIFAAWYPLKDNFLVQRFHQQLIASGVRKILRVEMHLHSDPLPNILYGCGMVIVNPPWHMDDNLKELMPQLLAGLQPSGDGQVRVDWLVPE